MSFSEGSAMPRPNCCSMQDWMFSDPVTVCSMSLTTFLLWLLTINFEYSQSHLGWHFWKLNAQSSNVSFATFQWKETFDLWALSCETAFENATQSGIGCTFSVDEVSWLELEWQLGDLGDLILIFRPFVFHIWSCLITQVRDWSIENLKIIQDYVPP